MIIIIAMMIPHMKDVPSSFDVSVPFVSVPSVSRFSCAVVDSSVISSLIDWIVMFALLFVIAFSFTKMS